VTEQGQGTETNTSMLGTKVTSQPITPEAVLRALGKVS